MKSSGAPVALACPLKALPGLGPERSNALQQLGINTLSDLLLHFPRRYEDRSRISTIAEAQPGATVTIAAEIVSARSRWLRGRQSLALVTLRDGTGEIRATFFGRGFLAGSLFRAGRRGHFTGVVGEYKGPCLKSPEYELVGEGESETLHSGRIVPIYPLCEGITQRLLRQWVAAALDLLPAALPDPLPPALVLEHGFPPRGIAFRNLHFPPDMAAAEQARTRFRFEEAFCLQAALLRRRAARQAEGGAIRHVTAGPRLRQLQGALPFALTAAQERVVGEILSDMAAPMPMFRLLQGDVGSGKTIVAAHAIAAACDSGTQAALLAPTEMLAEQHAARLEATLAPLGIRCGLLVGKMRGARTQRRAIASGDIELVVGTHALLSERTEFSRLGLVIIDEQHRFGVMQRQALREKGLNPDILHMTATPIPRSLAMTLYGSMDLSVIDALPPGRTPVHTRLVPLKRVPALYGWLREQCAQGAQAYVICPLVDTSEKRLALTPVLRHFEEISAGPLAGVPTACVHGRMRAEEKEQAMAAFRAGHAKVLFSTTVIEVGIDVPAANIIIIENAAHFGLTQLHQLRGRVGRGTLESWCFLCGDPPNEEAARRLARFVALRSGFDLAEADLELRGPGEMLGVEQAGFGNPRLLELLRDAPLLDRARRAAARVLAHDRDLAAPEHQALAEAITRTHAWLA